MHPILQQSSAVSDLNEIAAAWAEGSESCFISSLGPFFGVEFTSSRAAVRSLGLEISAAPL